MTTIDPSRALPVYQARAGSMFNDIIIRDIAIADLEELLGQAQAEVAALRAQLADRANADALGQDYPADV